MLPIYRKFEDSRKFFDGSNYLFINVKGYFVNSLQLEETNKSEQYSHKSSFFSCECQTLEIFRGVYIHALYMCRIYISVSLYIYMDICICLSNLHLAVWRKDDWYEPLHAWFVTSTALLY